MRCHPTAARHAALSLALCLLLAPHVAADVIHYKDGRTLEGRIVERTGTDLLVETAFGKVRVPLSKIERIEEKETAGEEFTRRRAALQPGDVAGLFELAVWARDQGLATDASALLHEVVAANPEHPLANEMLGRTRLDGRWFQPEELDAYVRSMEAEKLAQGLMFDDGRWRPEDEVMKRRGFRRWKDAWLPRREAETLAAVEDLARLVEVELAATSGEFVTLYSALAPDEASALIGPLDGIVRDVLDRLAPLPEEREVMLRYDVPVFLLPDADAVARFMDTGFVVRFSPVDGFEERFHDSGGFSLYWPRPLIGLRLATAEGGTRDELQRLGVLAHQLAHVMVQRFKGVLPCPAWIEAGFAALYEGLVTGGGSTTITSFRRDRDGEPMDPFVGGWGDYGEWQARLTESAGLGDVPALQSLAERRIADLDSRDIGVCWSVVRFLLERHPGELVTYLRRYAEHPDGQPHEPAELHGAAWKAAFALRLDEVEAEWRAWLLLQPTVLPPERLGR